jgi:O-antigen ligase
MSMPARWSLVVAAEAALVLFLLTWGNSFTGSLLLHRTQVAILAVLGGAGWVIILARPSRLPMLVVLAPLPLLASLALTSVPSPYPSLSWFATWQCAAYIGIGWLLAIQASDPVGRRNLVATLGIVVVVVIGVYLAQVAFAWTEWMGMGFSITALPLRPLGDGGVVQLPTWLGDVIALCAPIVIACLWIARSRAVAAMLAASGLVVVVLSGTRSVLLLVVVFTTAAAAVVLRDRANRRVALVASLVTTAVVVVGLGVIFMAGRSFDEGRTSAYRSAVDRFVSSPFLGTGPGTYGVRRMSDEVDVLSHLAFPDAHNVVLTAAAEAGVTGLLGVALSLLAYVLAGRECWRRARSNRLVILAATLGLAIVGGHAMGEVVFALVGIILLVLAALAIATVDAAPLAINPRRAVFPRAGLALGVACIILSSLFVIRNEMTLTDIADVDISMMGSPGVALEAARRATERSPDNAPAWWARMVAADAVADRADAVDSARKTVELEGFGQEWLSLALLMDRNGDNAGAQHALKNATSGPPLDPVVELNAAIAHLSAGALDDAQDSTRRLLTLQPDIEPILSKGPPEFQLIVGNARSEAAADLMALGMIDSRPDSLAVGKINSAVLIALSSEDREMARSLVRDLAVAGHSSLSASLTTVVEAWFGDRAAQSAHDAATTVSPTGPNLVWAWRLAAHACDRSKTDYWQRAAEIGAALRPTTPTTLGEAPDFQVRQLPTRYPGVIWRIDHPARPYVTGIWTYELGRPACVR